MLNAEVVQAVKDNNVQSAIRRMTPDTIQNLAPLPGARTKHNPTKSERRRQRKQAAKRKSMPRFSPGLAIKPAGVVRAHAAYLATERHMNHGGPEPTVIDCIGDPKIAAQVQGSLTHAEGMLSSFKAGGYREIKPGFMVRINNTSASVSPVSDDDGSPGELPEISPGGAAAAELVSKLNEAKAKRKAGTIRSLVQRFRRLRDGCHADAEKAFDASLETARSLTRARMYNGAGVNGGAIRDTAKAAFLKIEAKGCRGAQRLVEDALDKPVTGFKTDDHITALDAFIVGIKRVHSDADAPAAFGNAAQELGQCFEKSYYADVVTSCKKVRVIGGGADGKVLDLKVAAKLTSYELLLPVVESK